MSEQIQSLEPIPHQQNQEPRLDTLAGVSLESVIIDSAFGEGVIAPTHKRRTEESYYSTNFRESDIPDPAHFSLREQSVETTANGNHSTITAKTEKNIVNKKTGGIYPKNIEERLTLETRTPAGNTIKSRISILSGKDGDYYVPQPLETRIVNKAGGISEIKYADRPMSQRRIDAAKRLAQLKFGLRHYELPLLPRDESKHVEFDHELMEEVSLKAHQIRSKHKDMVGVELKRELLKHFHPDVSENPRAHEAAQYLETVDFDQVA